MSHVIVTGGAGFIGSNLVRGLIRAGHTVSVIDNFSTGRRENLAGPLARHPGQLRLLEGTVTDPEFLRTAFAGVETVFHQAALPSVPKSIRDPWRSNEHNITGTLAVLLAARDCGVRRVIYAASSSAYGDTPELPKIETLRQPSQYVPPQPQPRTQHLSQRAERIAMKRNKLNS